MSVDQFRDIDEECIIVQDQAAIAVYSNVSGGVTIRSERAWDDDADTYIVTTSAESALAVADAIYREIEALYPDGFEVRRKDPTAAERQQRRRVKQRETRQPPNADVTEVTPRVTRDLLDPDRDMGTGMHNGVLAKIGE